MKDSTSAESRTKVYRVVSAESGEMGARFGLEGGAQGSPKSPRKLSSRTEGVGGAVPPEEARERPQAPASFLILLLKTGERLLRARIKTAAPRRIFPTPAR